MAKVQLYYSTTASASPTAVNMIDGELALNSNIADGKLFYKDSSGAVQTIASRAVANRETTLQTINVASTSSATVTAAGTIVMVTITGGGFTSTLTLPAASSNANKQIELFLGNAGASAITVVSASANVNHNGTTSTALLSGGTCEWIKLMSDGSNWRVMASGKIL